MMERARELYERIRSGGCPAVQSLVEDSMNEDLFLDFKRSQSGGNFRKLGDNDRKNLARAVAGFANSEGGLLVWGVGSVRDPVSGCEVPRVDPTDLVARPRDFASQLNEAVSGVCLPVHNGVLNEPVFDSSDQPGYVVTYIPKGERTPYRAVIKGEQDSKYLIRAGSSFVATPHDVLAAMFGRRPSPRLSQLMIHSPATFNETGVRVRAAMGIRNTGMATAKELYFAINVWESPEGRSTIIVDFTKDIPWQLSSFAGLSFAGVSPEHLRLPPHGTIGTASLELSLRKPIVAGLRLELVAGCEGGIQLTKNISLDRVSLAQMLDAALESFQSGESYSGSAQALLVNRLLSTDVE